MLCTIRQAAECHPPVGRGTGKRVGSTNLLIWRCGNGSGGHCGREEIVAVAAEGSEVGDSALVSAPDHPG